jgi:hypothetical protein
VLTSSLVELSLSLMRASGENVGFVGEGFTQRSLRILPFFGVRLLLKLSSGGRFVVKLSAD